MQKVAIVTDSVACIPHELIKELNIHCVPFYIHIEGNTFRDLVNLDCASFYNWLPNANELPTTANPSSADYKKIYSELVENGYKQIVSIHITSLGSGAYQAAKIAKSFIRKRFPFLEIEVIDSLNVAMCQGWMVIEAARAALKGNTFENIINMVYKMIPITQMMQTADTLKYLYMGGRIGSAKHLMGSLLKIKPIISMHEGVIVPVGQVRTRQKAYQFMAEKISMLVGSTHEIKVAYLHANALSEIEKIRELIEGFTVVAESLTAELSPALGVHTGPGTAGLCYFPVID
jgi:DegV family protein with EDD domain